MKHLRPRSHLILTTALQVIDETILIPIHRWRDQGLERLCHLPGSYSSQGTELVQKQAFETLRTNDSKCPAVSPSQAEHTHHERRNFRANGIRVTLE